MADDGLPAVHPQVRSLLQAMVAADVEPPADLAADRAQYLESALRFGGAKEPVAATTDVVIPTADGARLPARVYAPQHAPETTALVVWLHGGGWYVGDIATFDGMARALANAAGAKVLLPEYRLAPEHPWPVPVLDAQAVVAWARGDGAGPMAIDPERIALGGESAGGQLAVVAARHAMAAPDAPPLRALLLAYPALDPTMSSEAYKIFADGPMLTKADMERCWSLYLGDADRTDPDVAPLGADVAGLPPTRIAVAGQDPLRDDGLRLAALLRDAGVDVHERVFDDMVHGFLRWGGVVDATHELIAWLAEG